MKYLATALLLAMSWAAQADEDVSKVNGAVRVEAGRTVGEVSSVNGSVKVEQGATARRVDTVNGSIEIGPQCTVGPVETVNGRIGVGDGSRAQRAESVNGSIKLGNQVRIAEDLSTVNGGMLLGRAAEVGGNVETVNGRIELDAAKVNGRLKSKNGDIIVGANSHVRGDILVEKAKTGWFNQHQRKPKITIGPNAVVEGRLKFEREVELYVSDSAKIGKVEGATVQRFSGSEP